MFYKIEYILFILFLIVAYSCGDKPISEIEIQPQTITTPSDINELLGDSARIIIYDNGKPISRSLLTDVANGNKDLFLLQLPSGEHLLEVFLTGPNENVVYMLDRVRTITIPDIKNTLNIELGQPLKFNTKSIYLEKNQEVSVSVIVDAKKLPEGFTSPEIHWTIDNIENGNSELGTITPDKLQATIKGPATLPSSITHFLGAYYEANGKKFISVVKLNYVE